MGKPAFNNKLKEKDYEFNCNKITELASRKPGVRP